MIFNKPIHLITHADVVVFCGQQIPENFILDYKQDFPKNLEKTIAAFANTYGGTIVIGVADSDGKPKLPVVGIPYVGGLSERVTQVVMNQIHPPILPEVQICPAVDGKTFVVIRVPQSEEVPHSVHGKQHIYVRTQNTTTPFEWEDYATTDQIEWLYQRRLKASELRSSLCRRAVDRAQNILDLKKFQRSPCVGSITIAPRYPHPPTRTPTELLKINESVSVRAYNTEFPSNRFHAEPVQGGFVLSTIVNQSIPFSILEVNQFGLIYYLEDYGLAAKDPKQGEPQPTSTHTLNPRILMLRLDLCLEYAAKLYGELGVQGIIDIQLSLRDILGMQPETLSHHNFATPRGPRRIIDKALDWDHWLTTQELANPTTRSEILLSICDEIIWALGMNDHVGLIRQFFEDNNRLK